jgi:hypothetical protein
MTMSDVNPAADESMKEDPAPVVRVEHAEGNIARLIEQQTAKVPSHWFLFAALGSMTLSLTLELAGRRRPSRFIGQWPTPLLVMGVYNKLVKLLGAR